MNSILRHLAAGLFSAWAFATCATELRVADRVFLVQDRENASLEFQMIVNAGCADEAGNQCRGLAHYLEHLILVGRNPETKDIALRFFPEAVTNGWTNSIATVYWHRVPARAEGHRRDLEAFFSFYSARLTGFDISQAEAERERNVVLQEHDLRLGSNAVGRIMRKLDRSLMPDHPLGQWTIGTPETIRACTLADARAFHRRWYKRDNVWFVIRGNVEPALVREIADNALRNIPAEPVEPRPSRKPPVVVPRHEAFVETDPQVTTPVVIFEKLVRFEADDLAHRARMAVLGAILASELPGSLPEALREIAKVTRSTPRFGLSRIAPYTYKFTISAEPIPETDPEGRDLHATIERYVDGLARLEPSERTVERMRNRLLEQRKRSDAIPAEVFQRLVSWLAGGDDPADLPRMPAALAGVTRADLMPLLRTLAGPATLASGTLLPRTGGAP